MKSSSSNFYKPKDVRTTTVLDLVIQRCINENTVATTKPYYSSQRILFF